MDKTCRDMFVRMSVSRLNGPKWTFTWSDDAETFRMTELEVNFRQISHLHAKRSPVCSWSAFMPLIGLGDEL
jgi:hypothetical protein